MRYGQLVIGGAAAGKTTYCRGLCQLLSQLKRKFVVVNLDAGNAADWADQTIDVRELVKVEEVGETENLGPNGSLLFCMEQVLVDFSWLEEKINSFSQDTYVIIDCPGQIELFTHSDVLAKLTDLLRKRLTLNLVCVNLVDCILICNKFNYLSSLLASLASMVQLELPHINVLSKLDLLRNLSDNLDTSLSLRSALTAGGEGCGDLRQLLCSEKRSDNRQEREFDKLATNLAELIDDYGLVGFQPLAVEDKELMIRLLAICDKSNGFSCNNPNAMTLDVSHETPEELFTTIEEKFIHDHIPGCAACRNPEASLVCGRCKHVKYCDRSCQAEHWKNHHRLNCKAPGAK